MEPERGVRDGSHLTERKRVIGKAVEMRSRRTFARVHVGFVNVNADKAKCALIAASGFCADFALQRAKFPTIPKK